MFRIKRFILNLMPDLIQVAAGFKAVLVAHFVIKRQSAYINFLQENGYKAGKMRSKIQFNQLPILDKDNYFLRYGTEKTLLNKSLTQAYTFEQSGNYESNHALF